MRICNKYLHGLTADTESSWDWPMEQPCVKDYAHWRNAMNLLLDERQFLLTPLGKWLAKPHLHWKWFYSSVDDTIYKVQNNGYIG